MLIAGMDPSEVEFLAEKEKVAILPNFSENKVYLISVSTRYSRSVDIGTTVEDPDSPKSISVAGYLATKSLT